MPDSQSLFQQAQELIPGGVNSPVRACGSVDSIPLFISKGSGSHIYSQEGQEYIDYVLSWGPLLLGHCHPRVLQASRQALENGSSFGAPCQQEIELAGAIQKALPGVEMVRLVNSGTEATMSALRLARAYTGRDKILKFTGCYHGHVDSLLVQAGSGVATLAIPGTPGVPEDLARQTLLAPYNDLEAAREIFQTQGQEIAAVILEPVAGNMGLVPPVDGFLQGLRELADQYSSLLIFDEVITGFRVAYSGAQGRFGVTPDLTCLGKIIGGGFPVGALGGKKDVMQYLAPCGPVYQAGTLAGNPVAMSAGLATLQELKEQDYQGLEEKTSWLAQELQSILQGKGLPVQLNQLGSMFTLFFTNKPVQDFASAQQTDQGLFASFYRQMREQGIYLPPANFECIFVSFAHQDRDLEQTLQAARALQF
ncbi:MAG: glutamate-1-semialdehyde 2,1-aminomutase [Thermodesulfobacteriota bacterium]